jgi:hypothetical protein
MTFTYIDPTNSNRDKVRFLIQDTDSTNPHMTDEEVNWLISEWADVYDAASAAADILAGSYAHKANYSKSVGDLTLSETFSTQSERFQALATTLRLSRMRRYTPRWVASADALQSTADRVVDTYNTDSHLGQFDNPRGSSEGTSLG